MEKLYPQLVIYIFLHVLYLWYGCENIKTKVLSNLLLNVITFSSVHTYIHMFVIYAQNTPTIFKPLNDYHTI